MTNEAILNSLVTHLKERNSMKNVLLANIIWLTYFYQQLKCQTTYYSILNLPSVDKSIIEKYYNAHFALHQKPTCMPKSAYTFKPYIPTDVAFDKTLETYNLIYNFIDANKDSIISYGGQENSWLYKFFLNSSAKIKNFQSMLYNQHMGNLIKERLEVSHYIINSVDLDHDIKLITLIERKYYQLFTDPGRKIDISSFLGTYQGFATEYIIEETDDLETFVNLANLKSVESFILVASPEMTLKVLTKAYERNLLRPPNTWIVIGAGLTKNPILFDSRRISPMFFVIEFSLDAQTRTFMEANGFVQFNDDEILLADMVTLSRSYAQNNLCPTDFYFERLTLNSGAYTLNNVNNIPDTRNYRIYRFVDNAFQKIGNIIYSLTENVEITKDISDEDLAMKLTESQLLDNIRVSGYKVLVVDNPPFSYINSNGKIAGIVIDYLDTLFASINITVNYIMKPNNMSELYDSIAFNEADMLGLPTILYDLPAIFHTSEPFMSTSFMMVYLDSERTPDAKLFHFVRPFTLEVWITLFFACLAISLTAYALDKISPNDERITIIYAFYFGFGSVLHSAGFRQPSQLSSKILYSLWFLICLIILTSYAGAYGAYFTSLNLKPKLNDPTQLFKQNKFKVGININGNLIQLLNHSIIPENRRLYTLVTEVYPPLQSLDEAIKEINKQDFVFLTNYEKGLYLANKYCFLKSDKFYSAFYSFITLKSNAFNSLVDDKIVAFTRDNIIKDIIEKHIPSNVYSETSCYLKSLSYRVQNIFEQKLYPHTPNSLDIADMAGLYFVTILGIILSLVVLTVEGIIKLVKHFRKKPVME